jgi:glyoxylase-like metal-dependent hydrolase (beta-lactamase superfamily II)
MADWRYTKGLHELGNGCWAYLLPDGGWGWSNAGLITDAGESLLVDTLFDLKLTGEMLDVMRDASPAARQIETVVNTHANGDHTFGNQLVKGARIVTTKSVGEAFEHEDANRILAMMQEAETYDSEAGRFMREIFAPFDFHGIDLPPATDTFEGALDLKVGSKTIHLVDAGPAHTASDILAYVPADRVVYTGDLLFVGGHPAIWSGPVKNWVKACDLILSWDVDIVVPGHGPISDKAQVREFRGYLEWIEAEGRKRYDAGMSFEEAANDIDLGPYDHWGDSERMVPNMMTLYGEFSGQRPEVAFGEIWAGMARYYARRKSRPASVACDCNDPNHKH